MGTPTALIVFISVLHGLTETSTCFAREQLLKKAGLMSSDDGGPTLRVVKRLKNKFEEAEAADKAELKVTHPLTCQSARILCSPRDGG